jgi:hypothetical protein
VRGVAILLCGLLLPGVALASPGGPDLDPLKDRQHGETARSKPQKVDAEPGQPRRVVKRRTVRRTRTVQEGPVMKEVPAAKKPATAKPKTVPRKK